MPQPTPVSPTNRLNKLGKYVNVGPLSIGGSRGPGGTCPLDRLTQKNDFFWCTFLVVLCQIGEQSKMSATTPPHRIGSALGDHGKCMLLSPPSPPLPSRAGFRRSVIKNVCYYTPTESGGFFATTANFRYYPPPSQLLCPS